MATFWARPSTIVKGEAVLVALGLGPLEVVAPRMIVYVIDEHDRSGLAYGTPPGPSACGEESFVVERDQHGTTFHVTGVLPTGPVRRPR